MHSQAILVTTDNGRVGLFFKLDTRSFSISQLGGIFPTLEA